jgi:hypothetical protein
MSEEISKHHAGYVPQTALVMWLNIHEKQIPIGARQLLRMSLPLNLIRAKYISDGT